MNSTAIRVMPMQKPGRSKQDYGTPRALIKAVEKRFGALAWDLAATAENAKAPEFLTEEEDSLGIAWHALEPSGLLWLNPPFARIEPWAAKCAAEMRKGARILFLTPASVGSNWFIDHVLPNASVYALAPRLTFEGCSDPYPKDCILSVFDNSFIGFHAWRWR